MCAQSQIVSSLWSKEQAFHKSPIKVPVFWNNALCHGLTPSKTNYTSQCDVLLWRETQGTERNEQTTVWKRHLSHDG